MNKKLVFHFFITKDWRENPVYKIHFNCLEYHKSCFDEAYFALSLEDPNDADSLYEIKQKLLDIFGKLSKIKFEVVKNTEFCECPTFKREIVDKLGEDDLVFFAHLKGAMDTKYICTAFDYKFFYGWICALYYFSLDEQLENSSFLNDIFYKTERWMSYGSLLTQFKYDGPHLLNKYEWYYSGTFFWINSKKLKNYIENNNIKLPEMGDRMYAERFLGNLYEIPDGSSFESLAGSYKNRYNYAYAPNRVAVLEYIDFLLMTEEEKTKYNEFVKKVAPMIPIN